MSDMICDRCGRTGIRWMGPLSNLTHTECPHCGGTNCQRADDYQHDDYCSSWDAGECNCND